MYILLDQFYPEREISVTSADPRFVTPVIKSMLRRKNRLMRSGRLDEASWMLCVTAFCTSMVSWNPDRWSGLRPAPANVLVVLEVLRADVRGI